MVLTRVITLTAVSFAAVQAQQAKHFVDWTRQAELGSSAVALRLMPAMSSRQWFWVETTGTEITAKLLRISDGHVQSMRFDHKDIARALVYDFAIREGEFGVASAAIYSHKGDLLTGLILVDFASSSLRVLDTGNFAPRRPAIDAAGNVWTVGWQRSEGVNEDPSDYAVIRAFDKTGKQVWSGVKRSELSLTKVPGMPGEMSTFAHGNHFFLYAPHSNRLVEIDGIAGKATVSTGPPTSGKVRSIGLARCDSGRLYLTAMSNQENYSYARERTGQWAKVEFARDGLRKENWLPQYPFCAANGSPAAALGFNEIGTLAERE